MTRVVVITSVGVAVFPGEVEITPQAFDGVVYTNGKMLPPLRIEGRELHPKLLWGVLGKRDWVTQQ